MIVRVNLGEPMIVKRNNKVMLYSHKGKVLGTFDSHAAALHREKQINWFKSHPKK